MNIKIFLKRLRQKDGLTQNELAEKLGVSHISLALFESGGRKVTKKFIEKLSNYLNIQPMYLSFFMFDKKYIVKNDNLKTNFLKIDIGIHRLTDKILYNK